MKIKKKIWGCLLSLLCIFMLVLPVMASESPETDSEVSAVTSEELSLIHISLATVILGHYTPFGMFGAALLFGAANALQIRLQTIGVSISPFLLAILPYALTLIAMLGAAGKSSEPESLSKPYIKGSR